MSSKHRVVNHAAAAEDRLSLLFFFSFNPDVVPFTLLPVRHPTLLLLLYYDVQLCDGEHVSENSFSERVSSVCLFPHLARSIRSRGQPPPRWRRLHKINREPLCVWPLSGCSD